MGFVPQMLLKNKENAAKPSRENVDDSLSTSNK